ncbi:hypothetical protein GX48_07884 [Paracoccidioides brasiliensis]|nr:hypothetical protein GX48_07884 [Paracoccidioides brasiliensis]
MPTLKQLTCQVEWAGSNVPFKEYGTTYGDGWVESYIAIPDAPSPFSINLKSNDYIAPGLAMFVSMDGVYQCNRNRNDLLPTSKSPEVSRMYRDVSFRVRQREERLPDGSWIGRPWRFEHFHLVEYEPNNPYILKQFEKLGTIQVVVVRCAADPRAESKGYKSNRACTPESAMDPGSEGEGDYSISSDQSFLHDFSGRLQERNDEIGSTFGGPFDGPSEDRGYAPKPHQQSYLQCGPSCHLSFGNRHLKPDEYIPCHNGGHQNPWHIEQQPIIATCCHASHDTRETILHGPNIPQSWTNNSQCHGGCYNPQHDLPFRNCKDNTHLPVSQTGHTHSTSSTSGESLMNNIFYAEPQSDNRFMVRPIVLNVSPQIFRDGPSRNNRNEDPSKVNETGYYVISKGKRVPESSSWGWREHNFAEAGANIDNNRKQKSRQRKGKSARKDNHEQQETGTDNQGEVTNQEWNMDENCSGMNENYDNHGSWYTKGNQQQDRSGGHINTNDGDGEFTPWSYTAGDQATNTIDPQAGDWNTNKGDNNDSNWAQTNDSTANAQPFRSSPAQGQQPPMQQIPNFRQTYNIEQPNFVSPLLSSLTRDEPPLYTVPKSVAQADSLTHQVQLGPHARYLHKIRAPEYQDDMDKPYAVFVFKYRTAGVIRDKFGESVVFNIDDERRKLQALPRAEIVNQLLRAQDLLANSGTNNDNILRMSPLGSFSRPQPPDSGMGGWSGPPNTGSTSANFNNESQQRSRVDCPPRASQWTEWNNANFKGQSTNTQPGEGVGSQMDQSNGRNFSNAHNSSPDPSPGWNAAAGIAPKGVAW